MSARQTADTVLRPSDQLKRQIDRWADTWLTATFAATLRHRARDPGPYAYPVAVFCEWRGRQFYLNVRYRANARPGAEELVFRHTRMTLTGFGRFDLAYFRHTQRWHTTHRGLTAAQCFRQIEANEAFWPLT
jgi:hypothetical protein